MASAIRLCYGPIPADQPRMASATMGVASRPSRVHLSLSQPSHLLSNYLKNCRVAHPVCRANCTLENSSLGWKNEENENKIVRGMTGISLVLACVLGVFNFKGMMNSKSATAYALTLKRSPSSHEHPTPPTMPPTLAIGGELALDSLVKMLKQEPSGDPSSRPQLPEAEPSPIEIDEFKLYALGLSKSGKPQEALKFLENACNKYKDKEQAKQLLNMALIELLIYQGNYKGAKERLDQLINHMIGESKRLSEKDKISKLEELYPFEFLKAEIFLYKAIVHTMLEKKDAAKWGEAFRGTLG